MPIAETYMRLAHNKAAATSIFNTIQSEYNLCLKLTLHLIQANELMTKNPKIRERILRRNPFVDPLNILQVQLLATWRSIESTEHPDKALLLTQLSETVNGITAGVRNFG